jgi:hypothetical protein
MSNESALVPVEQKAIIFYDDEITAVLVEIDNRQMVYVPLKPICDFLGVDWDGQRQRIHRDPVLSEFVKGAVITTAPSASGRGGGPQEMLCLPLDYLNGYLFGINANRVRPEIRERLIRYQRECYQVLATAFLEQTPQDPKMAAEMQSLLQIRELGRAIMQMAEQQMALTARVDKAAIIVGQHEKRLTALERRLSPREAITDEQAADIAEKVKAVAVELTGRDASKNHFQAIFAELHRRFRVSSYKNIRQDQYQAVLDFLDEWLGAAVA